jgi:hypothetical protein
MAHVLLCTVLLLTVSLADAMTTQGYLQLRHSRDGTDREVAKAYAFGVGEGLDVANAMLTAMGKVPLYCAPVALPLDYVSMLDTALEQPDTHPLRQAAREAGLGPVLLLELQRVFPCAPK